MAFTKPLPEWNNQGTEPPTSLKTSGWEANQKPPADYFNWLQYTAYQALQELQEKAADKNEITVQDGTTAQKGIVQLEDSTSSASTTKAATPNSVKTVNDALTTHQNEIASETTFGHVKIGSGLNVTDGVISSGGELVIDTFDSPGEYSWTAPEGINEVYITAAAGGGGGSFGLGSSSSDKHGGATGGATSFGSLLSLTGGGGAPQNGSGGAAGGINATKGNGLPGGSTVDTALLPFVINGGGNLFGVGASKNTLPTGYGCGGSAHYIDLANAYGSGGGGGGDCVIDKKVSVTPLQTYTITVGSGGKGGSSSSTNINTSNGKDGVLFLKYFK